MRTSINYYDVIKPQPTLTNNEDKNKEMRVSKQPSTLSLEVHEIVDEFIGNKPLFESEQNIFSNKQNVQKEYINEPIIEEVNVEKIKESLDEEIEEETKDEQVQNTKHIIKSSFSFSKFIKKSCVFLIKTTISAVVLFTIVLAILHFFN